MVELGALLFTRLFLGSVCLKNLRCTDWLLEGLKSEEPSYTKDKSAHRALDGGLEKITFTASLFRILCLMIL